ncbi:hypothetical protein L2E82_19425 [Cichorium intybus]|uniref:Uncharacterized protein n=1 Tax=Cichorium intybus TaxID=13427 RepID=A0ACB9FD88_CICIN|nr:hypothetical protein L2E82_19425 [Cichorium intybus]
MLFSRNLKQQLILASSSSPPEIRNHKSKIEVCSLIAYSSSPPAYISEIEEQFYLDGSAREEEQLNFVC